MGANNYNKYRDAAGRVALDSSSSSTDVIESISETKSGKSLSRSENFDSSGKSLIKSGVSSSGVSSIGVSSSDVSSSGVSSSGVSSIEVSSSGIFSSGISNNAISITGVSDDHITSEGSDVEDGQKISQISINVEDGGNDEVKAESSFDNLSSGSSGSSSSILFVSESDSTSSSSIDISTDDSVSSSSSLSTGDSHHLDITTTDAENQPESDRDTSQITFGIKGKSSRVVDGTSDIFATDSITDSDSVGSAIISVSGSQLNGESKGSGNEIITVSKVEISSSGDGFIAKSLSSSDSSNNIQALITHTESSGDIFIDEPAGETVSVTESDSDNESSVVKEVIKETVTIAESETGSSNSELNGELSGANVHVEQGAEGSLTFNFGGISKGGESLSSGNIGEADEDIQILEAVFKGVIEERFNKKKVSPFTILFNKPGKTSFADRPIIIHKSDSVTNNPQLLTSSLSETESLRQSSGKSISEPSELPVGQLATSIGEGFLLEGDTSSSIKFSSDGTTQFSSNSKSESSSSSGRKSSTSPIISKTVKGDLTTDKSTNSVVLGSGLLAVVTGSAEILSGNEQKAVNVSPISTSTFSFVPEGAIDSGTGIAGKAVTESSAVATEIIKLESSASKQGFSSNSQSDVANSALPVERTLNSVTIGQSHTDSHLSSNGESNSNKNVQFQANGVLGSLSLVANLAKSQSEANLKGSKNVKIVSTNFSGIGKNTKIISSTKLNEKKSASKKATGKEQIDSTSDTSLSGSPVGSTVSSKSMPQEIQAVISPTSSSTGPGVSITQMKFTTMKRVSPEVGEPKEFILSDITDISATSSDTLLSNNKAKSIKTSGVQNSFSNIEQNLEIVDAANSNADRADITGLGNIVRVASAVPGAFSSHTGIRDSNSIVASNDNSGVSPLTNTSTDSTSSSTTPVIEPPFSSSVIRLKPAVFTRLSSEPSASFRSAVPQRELNSFQNERTFVQSNVASIPQIPSSSNIGSFRVSDRERLVPISSSGLRNFENERPQSPSFTRLRPNSGSFSGRGSTFTNGNRIVKNQRVQQSGGDSTFSNGNRIVTNQGVFNIVPSGNPNQLFLVAEPNSRLATGSTRNGFTQSSSVNENFDLTSVLAKSLGSQSVGQFDQNSAFFRQSELPTVARSTPIIRRIQRNSFI